MICHIIMCYLFVFTFGFGVVGASISTCITFWLNLIIITVYVSLKEGVTPEGSWFFFNKDSFKDLGLYLKYGIPAALMLCLEWWSFEVLAIFAGMLSIQELAANVVLFNLIGIMFSIPFGMSFAVGALVGNNLGDGKYKTAKKYYILSMLCILILTAVILIFILSFRWYVPYIYTQEEKVVDLVANTIPLFSIMMFFDNIQGVASGTVRAIGYQKYASILTLVGFWMFSVPWAYIFAHILKLRLAGIWLGVPLGTLITSVSYNIICFTRDWKRIAEETKTRINKEKSELEQPLIKK